jgi:hypothetical protein
MTTRDAHRFIKSKSARFRRIAMGMVFSFPGRNIEARDRRIVVDFQAKIVDLYSIPDICVSLIAAVILSAQGQAAVHTRL